VWQHLAGRPPRPQAVAERLEQRRAAGAFPWIVRLRNGYAGCLRELPSGPPPTSTFVGDARLEIGGTAYAPGVWGTAVNPDTKLALLIHAFEVLGAGRVRLKTDVRNTRSQQAIARLGARYEATLRRYQRRADGSVRDTVLFSIVTEDLADGARHAGAQAHGRPEAPAVPLTDALAAVLARVPVRGVGSRTCRLGSRQASRSLFSPSRVVVGLGSQAMDLVIEPERPGDVEAIRDVVRRAFHDQQSVAGMVELIRGSPQYVPELALVARIGSEVVGFVMLSHADVVEASGRRHDVLTLSPLAVAPERERRGIGSALVRAALAAADACGAGIVTLEGSPIYYRRFGFRFGPDFDITIDLPDWAPAEAAQVFTLRAYDPTVRGTLRYPPAFRSTRL